jgi:hypothetical protein
MIMASEIAQRAEQLFFDAARQVGPHLSSSAAQQGKSYINERDHLQPLFKSALEAVCAGCESGPAVSRSLDHGLSTAWPRLGKFDISLRWNSDSVYGELKAGSDETAMTACAWDSLKCAFCLRHGVGAAMLLVGAAPEPLWQPRTLGTELFGTAVWDAQALRVRYEAGFRRWERDGYRPLTVPRRFATCEVGRTDFSVAGKTWLVGISRVEPFGRELLTWEPFNTAT